MAQRKIIHIDMDAFFASVEQRDFPEYKGKPLVVGGKSQRGVVAAASYEARKYGIYSAMPMSTALKKCPNIIISTPRFEVYKQVSTHIRAIFNEYTDLVEPLSLDEAFLDVTEPKMGQPSASLIAQEIRRRIWEETGLTASAGVSYNKFLAKIASDCNKPNGFFLIKPDEAESFLENLDIGDFFGVGKVTAGKFRKIGVYYGRDLKKLTLETLERLFGKAGNYYYNVVRGIDERPVQPYRERKSIGVERTFEKNINLEYQVNEKIKIIVEELQRRIKKSEKKGKTLTVKVKFADFTTITRSHTFEKEINYSDEIGIMINNLIPFAEIKQKGIRLLGVTLSNFHKKIVRHIFS